MDDKSFAVTDAHINENRLFLRIDGKPFSAEDVAYSLNTLNELGGKVKWGKDVQEVLESATMVDAKHSSGAQDEKGTHYVGVAAGFTANN